MKQYYTLPMARTDTYYRFEWTELSNCGYEFVGYLDSYGLTIGRYPGVGFFIVSLGYHGKLIRSEQVFSTVWEAIIWASQYSTWLDKCRG